MKQASIVRYTLATAVSLAASAVFIPSLWNGFILWDDDSYVFANFRIRSLGREFFRWAFTDTAAAGFWHPVTWISHAVDYALWGLNPLGHHLTSILLHGLNTFLVVLLVLRLFEAANASRLRSGRPPLLDERSVLIAAGVTGLLFGIHPLRVESVAWVSERKDLLYALFFLLSTMAYLRFVSGRGPEGVRTKAGVFLRDRWYLLTLFLFALSLASKPMAVTLPLVLLLLDWYPLDRVRTLRDLGASVAEKLPFFGLSLLLSVVTVQAQQAAGAMASWDVIPAGTRFAVASRSLLLYLENMVLPFRLQLLYVYPRDLALFSAAGLVPVLLVILATAACFALRKAHPLWPAVWGYYVVTLLPALGIVQVGLQSMADRFTYLPSLGPFLLAGLGAARLWARAGSFRRSVIVRGGLAALAAAAAVLLCVLTVRQAALWHDSLTFWNAVIEKEPLRLPLAYSNRALIRLQRKEYVRALEDCSTAIGLAPSFFLAYYARGNVYLATGRYEEALADFGTAIRMAPRNADNYSARGQLLARMKQYGRAVDDLTTAISLDPALFGAYAVRGAVNAETGRLDQAAADYTAAISLNPGYADAYIGRGIVFKTRGQYDRALADYDRAIELDPSSARAYNNRGVVFKHMNRLERAIADYTRAVELDPSFSLAYLNRAVAYAATGAVERAVEDYTKALLLDPALIRAYLDRGALYRALGRNDLAADDFRKACGLGSGEGCAAIRGFKP